MHVRGAASHRTLGVRALGEVADHQPLAVAVGFVCQFRIKIHHLVTVEKDQYFGTEHGTKWKFPVGSDRGSSK